MYVKRKCVIDITPKIKEDYKVNQSDSDVGSLRYKITRQSTCKVEVLKWELT